jgi:3-mercaptopyruvate sulfurtransferase SseA
MKPIWHALLGGAIVAFCLLAAPLAQANPRPLVDAAWLQQALAAGDVLVLDAQPGKLHEAGHIPGAVHVDLFAYGPDEADAQAMQRRIQSWGVSPGRTVVIYDHGGSFLAPRLYYELLYRGHPPERLHLLDGGMAKWRAVGGAVTQDKTAPPPAGSFAVRHRADVRADLPEVLVAAGDAQRHALVDALELEMYFGATKFFDRAGICRTQSRGRPRSSSTPTRRSNRPRRSGRWRATWACARSSRCTRTAGAASRPPCRSSRCGRSPVTRRSSSTSARSSTGCATRATCRCGPTRRRTSRAARRGSRLDQSDAARVRRHAAEHRRRAQRGAFAAGHIPRRATCRPLFSAIRQALSSRHAAPAPGGRGPATGARDGDRVERGLDKASALAFLALQSLDMPRVSVLMTGTDEWALRGLPWEKKATEPPLPSRHVSAKAAAPW